MQEKEIMNLKKAALEMRKDALLMALSAKNEGAHLGGGLSMIEIMAVLYLSVMKVDPQKPEMEERDRFILSKGHGVLALYAALYQAGFIKKEELETFKNDQTDLYGHPSLNMKKGIEFSSGSLGQGLSLGVGTALALKRKRNFTSKVYVLLGDGECDEGSVWEAAASAAHFHLENLTVIVDKNGLQYDGQTETVLSMERLSKKFEAFGFDTFEVDGHDFKDISTAFVQKCDHPKAIIAHTVKGKGVSFMENKREWHHARLTQKQYEQAIAELEVVKC